jgi:tripartite-type tricarboxylate transporter receptor subunit TctC
VSRTLVVIICSVALGGPLQYARAQSYPVKPVRVIVSLAPAGGLDVTSRIFANKLGEHLNQQIVVENRPGAGGAVAGDLAAKAPADGYTLLTASIGYAVIASSHRNISYDPVRDLTPVAVMVNVTNLLVVHPSLPVKSVKELIAFAKAHPGALSYSSGGNGASAHLMLETFKLATGTDMLHIPYKGTGPGMVDLLAGRVQLTCTGIASALDYIKQGRLRLLATPGTKRSLSLPDLPTIAEAGVPGYGVDNWYAVFAPAATPKDVLALLNAEAIRIFHAPELKERLFGLGLEPAAEPLANTNAYVKSEIARWAKVVKAANIVVE